MKKGSGQARSLFDGAIYKPKIVCDNKISNSQGGAAVQKDFYFDLSDEVVAVCDELLWRAAEAGLKKIRGGALTFL